MAEPAESGQSGVLTDDELYENVRRIIRTLLALSDRDLTWLGQQLGMPRSTIYGRMAANGGTRFTVTEIYRIARLFDVPSSVFFEPASELWGGFRGGFRKARFLTPRPGADPIAA